MTELVVRSGATDRADSAAATSAAQPISGAPADAAARQVSTGLRRDRSWTVHYLASIAVADIIAIAVATEVGWLVDLGVPRGATWHFFLASGFFVLLGWLLALQIGGSYQIRRNATGAREFQNVLGASARLVGVLSLIAFLAHVAVFRAFILVVIPVGAALIVVDRYLVRRFVYHRRAEGRWTSSILAVGTAESVRHLIETTHRGQQAGLRVIGACVEDAVVGDELAPGVRVLGAVATAAECAEQIDADVVAVAGAGIGPRRIRELGWALEGAGREMVLAPGLTDVAGPRLHITPVEGLPLMWVDRPQFSGSALLLKRCVDLALSALLLLIAAPVLIVIAVIVRLTSAGPALYRSTRIGANGKLITVYKFRSMYVGADRQKNRLLAQNEGDGVLFKMRRDPRVTPVGRILRKFSLDEVPQLFNVLGGSMSLVGPRPPLPDEVERYDPHVRRRLLVKPGLTGLWQVSGRSDLPWEESVRLDLYYVENWSIGLDLLIILRTVWAVIRCRGAY